jgi:AhpC/TSA family protein
MLADPDSRVIRDYHVLNTEAVGQFQGMARPGYFFIDPKGIIREKFFEAKYRERLSGNNVIAKLFPELGEEVINVVEAPHLEVGVQQSDQAGVPGSLITLIAEIRLPRDIHVYAPGTKGYKPIELVIDPTPNLELRPPVYPRSRVLFMPAINERVPVFERTFRIRQDVKISSAAEFSNSLSTDGKALKVRGTLHYQACDSKTCFLPNTLALQWQLKVLALDRQRAPEDIRHK